ncbi:LLM class flavin-dependent oxidoreductase [Babesia caballi]|uniref:LLM class flavin-dependent oxidoreductase n=1 Tax=Babesia caballi TaxID=5871 RepID=A0AAV4LQ19_BABCB|nr:LLM class flavin-dependent oxidoreductase [Babesia caballi]
MYSGSLEEASEEVHILEVAHRAMRLHGRLLLVGLDVGLVVEGAREPAAGRARILGGHVDDAAVRRVHARQLREGHLRGAARLLAAHRAALILLGRADQRVCVGPVDRPPSAYPMRGLWRRLRRFGHDVLHRVVPQLTRGLRLLSCTGLGRRALQL